MPEDAATAWFEPLYADAAAGRGAVPWDAAGPSPALAARVGAGGGARAVVVGCGLGDDAALVAARGWRTTAFDVAPTALRLARERFPDSAADFVEGDLLALPDEWLGAFDLVVEHFTVQALPLALRGASTAAVRSLVAPGGRLLALGLVAEDGSPERPGPPWRFTREEMVAFADEGLELVFLEVEEGGELWVAECRRSTVEPGP